MPDDPRVKQLSDCVVALAKRHRAFTLECDFGSIVNLVAQVQLALRHPANAGYSAQQAAGLIDQIIGRLEQSEPEIGPLLRLGFDRSHDVPVGRDTCCND